MIQLPSGVKYPGAHVAGVPDTVTDYHLHNEKANVESAPTVNGFSFSGQVDKTPVWRRSQPSPGKRRSGDKTAWSPSSRATVAFSQISTPWFSCSTCQPLLSWVPPPASTLNRSTRRTRSYRLTQARNQLLGMVNSIRISWFGYALMGWKIPPVQTGCRFVAGAGRIARYQ